jgi:hypothetical protein
MAFALHVKRGSWPQLRLGGEALPIDLLDRTARQRVRGRLQIKCVNTIEGLIEEETSTLA